MGIEAEVQANTLAIAKINQTTVNLKQQFSRITNVIPASATSDNPLLVLGDLDGKVDKVEGYGLSKNDFTDEYKEKLDTLSGNIDLSNYATKGDLEGKVDTVPGKGLSQNDFTNEYKDKLDNLDDNIDLSNYVTKGDLDGKVDKVEGKGLSQNDFTEEYKNKLDNLDENIDLSNYATKGDLDGKVDVEPGKVLSDNNLTDELLAKIELLIEGGSSSGGNVDLTSYVTKTALAEALVSKVDTVEGKGLSTCDFTPSHKTTVESIIDVYAQKTAVSAALSTKVDKLTLWYIY